MNRRSFFGNLFRSVATAAALAYTPSALRRLEPASTEPALTKIDHWVRIEVNGEPKYLRVYSS